MPKGMGDRQNAAIGTFVVLLRCRMPTNQALSLLATCPALKYVYPSRPCNSLCMLAGVPVLAPSADAGDGYSK